MIEEEPIVVEAAPKVTIIQSFQNTLKKLTEKIGISSDTDEKEILTDRKKVKCEKGVEEVE